jgi:hypothetical protein
MSAGQIAGILSAIGTVATAFGAPEVAAITGNSLVAYLATAAVGAIGSLIAGHLKGAKAA